MGTVVVDPAGKLDGIQRLIGSIGDYETGDAIVVFAPARLKRTDPDLLADACLSRWWRG